MKSVPSLMPFSRLTKLQRENQSKKTSHADSLILIDFSLENENDYFCHSFILN